MSTKAEKEAAEKEAADKAAADAAERLAAENEAAAKAAARAAKEEEKLLITVVKDGESMRVHPTCVADHVRVGWRVAA